MKDFVFVFVWTQVMCIMSSLTMCILRSKLYFVHSHQFQIQSATDTSPDSDITFSYNMMCTRRIQNTVAIYNISQTCFVINNLKNITCLLNHCHYCQKFCLTDRHGQIIKMMELSLLQKKHLIISNI